MVAIILVLLIRSVISLELLSYHAEGGQPEAPLVASTMLCGRQGLSGSCVVKNLASSEVMDPKHIKGGISKYDISGMTKLRFLYRYLVDKVKTKKEGAEDIIFLDGSDVVYAGCGLETIEKQSQRQGDFSPVLRHLQAQLDRVRNSTRGDIVLGAEFNPYQVQGKAKAVSPWARHQCPYLNTQSMFPGEHYRFINSGFVGGQAKVLLPVVRDTIKILGKNKQLGDQGAYQIWLNTHNGTRGGVDFCASLVLNMARPHQQAVADSYLRVRLQEGTPPRISWRKTDTGDGREQQGDLCFIHFNGWSKKNSAVFQNIKQRYHLAATE